jgi:hypothetical protein
MTIIYNYLSNLPVDAEEFDEAYVEETGDRRAWLRTPGTTNYSWAFPPGSFIYQDEDFLDSLNNQNKGFQLSFWYETTDRDDFMTNGSPLFSFDRIGNTEEASPFSKILDRSSNNSTLILNDQNTVEVIANTPFKRNEWDVAIVSNTTSENEPFANKWLPDNGLQYDSDPLTGQSGRIVGPGSLWFRGNNNPTLIRSDSSLINFTDPFAPFTISTYHDAQVGTETHHNTSSGIASRLIRPSDVYKFTTLVNFEGSDPQSGTFKIDADGITHHGVNFKIVDSTNIDRFQDELAPSSTAGFKHKHHLFAYDGYDYYYYNRNSLLYSDVNYSIPNSVQPLKTIIDPNHHIELGDLSGNEFFRDRDAGFQIKVPFPYSSVGGINQNGVLFTVGDYPNRTRIELTNDSNGTAGRVLQFECGNLVGTTTDIPLAFNSPGFRDGPEHIVSWDYDISEGKIRLWIDGSLKILKVGGTWAGDAWAKEGASNPITAVNEISPITNSSIRQIDTTYGPAFRYGYGGTTLTSPIATANAEGNVDFKYRRNNFGGYTSFSIGASGTSGPILPINQNKIYYFEVATSANIGRTIKYQATLQDAGWDGNSNNGFLTNADRGVNNNYDPRLTNVHQHPYGDLALWFLDGATKHTVTTQKYANRIHQGSTVILPNYIRHSWIIDTASSTPRGLYFENGVYRQKYDLDLPNYALQGGGVILAFNGWDLGGTENDNNSINIIFNRDNWSYDPISLFNSYADVTSGISPIAKSNGVYSGQNFIDWPVSDANTRNSLGNKLRYYHCTFSSFENQKVVIGGERSYSNPDKEHGLTYAQAHVARTGGQIRTISNTAELDAALYSYNVNSTGKTVSKGSAQDGDALLLEPGYYEILGIEVSPEGVNIGSDVRSTSIFSIYENLLICGNTDTPASVRVLYVNEYTHLANYAGRPDFSGSVTGKHIFEGRSGFTNTLAFLDLSQEVQSRYTGIGRDPALFYNGGGGKIYKCRIDYSTYDASGPSTPNSFITYDNAEYDNVITKRIIENCQLVLSTDRFWNYYYPHNQVATRKNHHKLLIANTSSNVIISNSTVVYSDPNLAINDPYRWRSYGHNRFLLSSSGGKYLYGTLRNFHIFSERINPWLNDNDSVQPGLDLLRTSYLKNTGILNNPTPSTELLIQTEGSYKTRLRLDDNGIVTMYDGIFEDNVTNYPSTRKSTGGWIYTTVQYHPPSNSLKIAMRNQDGTDDSITFPFFNSNPNQDSNFLSNTILRIGASQVWDSTQGIFENKTLPVTFVNGYKQYHELLFQTETSADSPLGNLFHFPTNIPAINPQYFDSANYDFFLARTEGTTTLPNDILNGMSFQGSIDPRIDAPYPAGVIRWHVNAIYKKDSNDGFTYFKDSNYTRGGITNTLTTAVFSDSYYSDPTVGPPLDVVLNFKREDDLGNPIVWNIDEINKVADRLRIGQDSTSTKFLIRQVNKSSQFGDNHSATINFSCKMADLSDSSDPLFFKDEIRTILRPIERHTVYYNRFVTEVVGQDNFPWFNQLIEMERADSTVIDSDFTFHDDSYPSIGLYSTIGSLP